MVKNVVVVVNSTPTAVNIVPTNDTECPISFQPTGRDASTIARKDGLSPQISGKSGVFFVKIGTLFVPGIIFSDLGATFAQVFVKVVEIERSCGLDGEAVAGWGVFLLDGVEVVVVNEEIARPDGLELA